jgi:hypothetical protein
MRSLRPPRSPGHAVPGRSLDPGALPCRGAMGIAGAMARRDQVESHVGKRETQDGRRPYASIRTACGILASHRRWPAPRVPEPASMVPRTVRAERPNHVWMVDLTPRIVCPLNGNPQIHDSGADTPVCSGRCCPSRVANPVFLLALRKHEPISGRLLVWSDGTGLGIPWDFFTKRSAERATPGPRG